MSELSCSWVILRWTSSAFTKLYRLLFFLSLFFSTCPSFFCSQYKKQHTLLHKVNGALMLITFFICRVLLFPYLYYVYGRYVCLSIPLSRRAVLLSFRRQITQLPCGLQNRIMEPFPQFLRRYASIPFYKVPLAVPWHFNLGAGLLMAPQLYWFFLICRGALRLFTGSSRSQRSHASTAAAKEQQTDGHTPPQPSNGYSGRPSEPELTSHWVVGWAGGDEERREMRMYQWVRKLSRRPETSSNKGEKKKRKATEDGLK